MKSLADHGVQTVINYPVALPFLPAYERYRHVPAEFPRAHFNQSRILSLPIYPEITTEQMDIVIDALGQFCAEA
jgi:dTDP-4-amino-4,6-dideoxygalactose transaminase